MPVWVAPPRVTEWASHRAPDSQSKASLEAVLFALIFKPSELRLPTTRQSEQKWEVRSDLVEFVCLKSPSVFSAVSAEA